MGGKYKVGYLGSGIWWCGLDFQVQDRERWCVIVNAIMSFRVPWNAGNFLIN
jgi:hypothetical protein